MYECMYVYKKRKRKEKKSMASLRSAKMRFSSQYFIKSRTMDELAFFVGTVSVTPTERKWTIKRAKFHLYSCVELCLSRGES